MPDMAAAAIPVLPRAVVTTVAGHYTSFDAGRGCPFQCSFCTIINVQGRKSRYRTPDDVEAIVRANAAQGVTRFFVTDDNFARNRNWEPILDRLIDLRENEGFRIRLLLQVDTLCHRIPGFIEKAARAGCNAVFIGLENINPASLMGAKKRQNKIWEYREMLLAWKRANVMTWAGYILGFPDRHAANRSPATSTPSSANCRSTSSSSSSLRRCRAPRTITTFTSGGRHGPGHEQLRSRACLHRSPADVGRRMEAVYRDAWARYYTDEHVETVLRRAFASGVGRTKFTAC